MSSIAAYSRRVACLLSVVALCLLAAGCKSSNTASSAGAATSVAATSSSARPVAPSSSAPSSSAPVSSSAPGGSGTLPTSCPTAAAVSAAIGFTVATVLPNGDATSLSCTYVTGGVDTLEINYQKTAAGTTAASIEAKAKSSAAQGTTITPISGYGQAAFTSVEPASKRVGMLVLDGGVVFSTAGGTSLTGLENLVKYILAAA